MLYHFKLSCSRVNFFRLFRGILHGSITRGCIEVFIDTTVKLKSVFAVYQVADQGKTSIAQLNYTADKPSNYRSVRIKSTETFHFFIYHIPLG